MQPERQPDDIHSILGRFTSWAGKQAEKGHAGDEGIREISYEEAIERLRSRRRTPSVKLPIPVQPATVAPAEGAEGGASSEPAASFAVTAEAEGTVPKTAPECEGQPAAKRSRPVRASARGKAAAATAARGAADRSSARNQSRKAKTPEFRVVLAKSVAGRGGAVPGKATKINSGKTERDQRVSVRLSREEERQLQQCAEQAGVTVSQYLRQCALTGRAARREKTATLFAAEPIAQQSALESVTAEKATKAGLGEWITLLRTRFLSSPRRFAERA